jgi:hypothetical protein
MGNWEEFSLRKHLLIVLLLSVFLTMFVLNREYYPPLPISSISKREAVSRLEHSSENIVKIAEEDGYEWYITRMKQGRGYKNVTRMVSKNGWELKNKDGNGLFFMKKDRTIIVMTQMWTGNYILCKIPNEWRNK